jgi:hypothetical protein
VRQLKAQGEVPQDLEVNENQEAIVSGIEFVEGNDEGESSSSHSDSDDDSDD